MYIMQILKFLETPHTHRQIVQKFGEEKHHAIYDLLKHGAIKRIGFVEGETVNKPYVYACQATGKPYINQKTRKYYGL